jgi:hypothetical protein
MDRKIRRVRRCRTVDEIFGNNLEQKKVSVSYWSPVIFFSIKELEKSIITQIILALKCLTAHEVHILCPPPKLS